MVRSYLHKIFNMTTHQIDLIKSSWKMAAGDPVAVGGLFYGRLFKIAPEIEPLFSHATIAEQSVKLTSILSYMINKLDKLDDIAVQVVRLAKRNVYYGLKEEHYTAVGLALIWTLRRALAEKWNEELQDAWLLCYNTLFSAMIEASEYASQKVA
ncbi:MAG: hemin receptor [Bacteroidetes bacterium]|nr:MAG: hemin receptor [Bacteroidota bacterium]